jgi:hypothetical protein
MDWLKSFSGLVLSLMLLGCNLNPFTPSATPDWRGCMFVPATPGMPNNRGVSSQLDCRGCHSKPNENTVRIDMLQCVKNWGGNTLVYIRGEFCRGNPVLDMALNGMKHPGDGHYLPVKAPTASNGEVDWAMWAKGEFGIDRHVCFIWNDNTSVPFTENIVAEAVASYAGCRLGMENMAFGVCLETDEIMPDPNAVAARIGWIQKYAPNSPVIVGSANANFLMAVGNTNPKVLLWLEQAGHPVNAPLTRSTFPAYLSTLKSLANRFGKGRVVPGEWWASNPDDVKWMTDQLLSNGFTFLGAGRYK